MRGSDFSLPSPLIKRKDFSWLLAKSRAVLCMPRFSAAAPLQCLQWPEDVTTGCCVPAVSFTSMLIGSFCQAVSVC